MSGKRECDHSYPDAMFRDTGISLDDLRGAMADKTSEAYQSVYDLTCASLAGRCQLTSDVLFWRLYHWQEGV